MVLNNKIMLLLMKYCEPKGRAAPGTQGLAPRHAQEPGVLEAKLNIVKPDQVWTVCLKSNISGFYMNF